MRTKDNKKEIKKELMQSVYIIVAFSILIILMYLI